MPNTIKYNTGTEANALGVGDWYIGTHDVSKGPTSSTGFYNGINPPSGGYTIYLNKGEGGPSIAVPSSDADLISQTNGITGESLTTINQCFSYFAGQSDKMVMNEPIAQTSTQDLVMFFDSNNVISYAQTGGTAYDISNNTNNADLKNGLTTVNGIFVFDGVDDYARVQNDSSLSGWGTAQTIAVWMYHTVTSNRRVIWNQAYGGFGTWTHESGNSISNYYGNAGGNSQPYVGQGSSTTPTSQWNLNITTRSTTTQKWYQNGVNTRTNTNPYGTLASTTAAIDIGYGYTGNYWVGRMSRIMAWDAELTAAQVSAIWYGGPIVTSDLTLAFNARVLGSFEDGDSTVNSLAGTLTGTLTNGVGWNNEGGGTWDLDGVDDFISISTYTFGNGNFAVSMWVNADDMGSPNLLSNTSGGPVANAFGFGSNKIHYRNYDGAWQLHNGNTTLSTGTWYHLTWVNYAGASASEGTMKMFVNGVVDSSAFNSYVTNGGPCNAIGSSWFNKFNGRIASVQFYDESLTDAQVAQNYYANVNQYN